MLPLVDDQNPLYCPGITADAYLQSLRTRIAFQNVRSFALTQNQDDLSQSFAHTFGRLFHYADSSSELEDTTFRKNFNVEGEGLNSSQSLSEDLPPYSPLSSTRNRYMSRVNAQITDEARSLAQQGTYLKRKGCFSDFDAPPKYARSPQSPYDSSFDVDTCHETLRYDVTGSTPELKEPPAITLQKDDDTLSLIKRLDVALPGLRLNDKLFNLGSVTAQDICDVLAKHGYLNDQALKILRYSAVKTIVLAPSMFDENGLNLMKDDIYSIFDSADAFRFLTELSFSGIRIKNSDLQHIHHLPSLAILHLNETGIGNEGVFLLVSLKRSLAKLFLTANHDINNDAVPALLCLDNLAFLSILDTGIDMVGLRRIAQHMHQEDHVMDIEIPFACEAYVDNVMSQYLLYPLPPLMTNPHICGHLTSTALKRNLEAHAARNPSIVASGTRPEMLHRLINILTIRKLDLLVIDMLEGGC